MIPLAALGGAARGLTMGLQDLREEEDRQRRIERERSDMAWADEARGRQRTQWGQADEERERQKRIRAGLAEIAKPYTPEEIDLGPDADGKPSGKKGYRIDGQLFESADDPKAQQILKELNSPLGQAKRAAQAYMREGDYAGAQKVLADATRMSVDQFHVDKLQREAKYQAALDKMHQALVGEPGTDIFDNAAKIATTTNLFGLQGKEIRAERSGNGRVVMGVYTADGKRDGQLAEYENTPGGRYKLLSDFRQGSPEQMMAWGKEAADRERMEAEDKRKATSEDRKQTETERHNRATEGALQIKADTAAKLAARRGVSAVAGRHAATADYLLESGAIDEEQADAIRRGAPVSTVAPHLGGGRRITASQERSNLEIDAARELVSGLSADEIRRRTQKTSATGRDNPDYDPGLARAASLAARRKVGADDWFDGQQRGGGQPGAGTGAPGQGGAPDAATGERGDQGTGSGLSADLRKRFRADKAMNAYRLGKETPDGVEVLDSKGKVRGYFN